MSATRETTGKFAGSQAGAQVSDDPLHQLVLHQGRSLERLRQRLAGAEQARAHRGGLDLEDRLSQLCRWAVDAEARGQRYALRLPDRELPADRGGAHLSRCLTALALYALAPEGPDHA